MNLKTTVLALSLFSFCIVFSSGHAIAEVGYCTKVKVIYAGANVNGYKVKLQNTQSVSCGNWAPNAILWFYLDNGVNKNGNAMLAATLNALASGTTIFVKPKDPTSGGIYSNGSFLVEVNNEAPTP